MNHRKLYPGMVNNSVEFFVHDHQTMVMQNGTIKDFSEITFPVIQILRETIKADPEIESALMLMHPESEVQRLEKFVRCRFGGLDFESDIANGVLQDGEFWECPLRGGCAAEGILCRLPIVNGQRLNKLEVDLIRLLATKLTNETIAETLDLPKGTFNQKMKLLYEKLNVQNRPEATSYGHALNLI